MLPDAALTILDKNSASAAKSDLFVGVATIDRSGTICLRMLSKSAEQPRAEGYFCYKKTDDKYEYIRKHVGKIKPGQEKSIAPFPKN